MRPPPEGPPAGRETADAGDGRLPDLLLVGAPRCGTTSLHHYLGGHPQVFMTPVKEPRFFSAQVFSYPGAGPGDERVRPVRTLEEYRRLTAGAGDARVVGEASPENLYWHRQVIPRIRQTLGQPRILILLRDPVERAFSAWCMRVRERREALSFEQALAQEEARLAAGWDPSWAYLGGSLYAAQVASYLESFGQVHVALYEDLVGVPARELRRILEFLAVDADAAPDRLPRLNVSGRLRSPAVNRWFVDTGSRLHAWARRLGRATLGERGWVVLREATRARTLAPASLPRGLHAPLAAALRDDVERLQGILGRDLSAWLRRPPRTARQRG
ncbi:MAG TPA: sulfotransferase [Thermoanaerobaculia bacterium]|nr:sulfotransferase [Thermoanaerobaculia bacterium]